MSSKECFYERFVNVWHDLTDSPAKHTLRYSNCAGLFRDADDEISRLNRRVEELEDTLLKLAAQRGHVETGAPQPDELDALYVAIVHAVEAGRISATFLENPAMSPLRKFAYRRCAEEAGASQRAIANAYDTMSGSAEKPKPTIEDLERLLKSEDDTPVEILPDGSIRPVKTSGGQHGGA